MRVASIFLLVVAIALFSCNGNKKGKLIGAWHSVRLENKDIDSFFIKSQWYIDSIGKNNDPATNMQLYGTTNMDSLRQLMQEQYDSAKSIQLRSVTNTIFTFRDSTLLISFNGNLDTCIWHMNGANKLVIEDQNKGGGGDKMAWEILELSDTALILKMPEDTSFSKVTFHPEKM